MSEKMSLHGQTSDGFFGYSRLLPEQPLQPPVDVLEKLAEAMSDEPDTVDDKPDSEENLYVPAGYTYLGQFVDHDLTFDTRSSLDAGGKIGFASQRTPRFDLDCVYGPGPDAAPYMYQDGVRLIEGNHDLPRSQPKSGGLPRAIIGDPRNDENSIVCNLQIAFIRFHNAVVEKLAKETALKGAALFDKARNEVRWTYQRILVEDFLPRIVNHCSIISFDSARDPDRKGLTRNEGAYVFFTADKRGAIPLEFAGAIYRFGHSMVRNGYRLNQTTQLPIFVDVDDRENSLVGFGPLSPKLSHYIDDWSLFFPSPDGPSKSWTPGAKDDQNDVGAASKDGDPERLQFAYRIDPTLVNPLAHLPPAIAGDVGVSLPARNLKRGRKFLLASGQTAADALNVAPLERKYLVCRKKDEKSKTQTFEPIPEPLREDTPLWFYVLAEAQRPVVDWWLAQGAAPFGDDDLLDAASETATQLGPVGGRMLLEVFNGLLDADPESYRRHPDAACWKPLIENFRMWYLVNCAFSR